MKLLRTHQEGNLIICVSAGNRHTELRFYGILSSNFQFQINFSLSTKNSDNMSNS